MVDLTKWENVKNTVHMRLISSEWQPDLFDQVVKAGVAADVWRAWYLNLGAADGMTTIAPITCSMLQKWGVSLEQLERTASENDAGSYSVRSMSEIMGGCMPDPYVAMYIVTNNNSFLGAAGILDASVQARLQELLPSGAYVLPSSVHEIIAVPSDAVPLKSLASTVREINREQVQEQDRLSDHVFRLIGCGLAVAA